MRKGRIILIINISFDAVITGTLRRGKLFYCEGCGEERTASGGKRGADYV